jgi:ZIP family zinc transporter
LVVSNLAAAFLLTLLAGLATGIGSGIAYLARRTNKRFLAASLGFSAGVMIYISFVELYRQAESLLASSYGGAAITAVSFFGGMLLIAGIDYIVPSYENPHHGALIEEMAAPRDNQHLERLGILTALAIGIHNFPEGIATFFAALTDPAVGVSVAIAIALHNIPEGISISIPVYYATRSRKKAFWYSFSSGLSEPLGAMVGFFALRPFLSDPVLGAIFAAVGGIMVFISLDQLIPSAKKYDEGHQSVYGLVGGMAVMAVTLLFL